MPSQYIVNNNRPIPIIGRLSVHLYFRPSDRRSKTPDGHYVLRRRLGTMSWWRFAERRRSREATSEA